jgi:hypothetical protein
LSEFFFGLGQPVCNLPAFPEVFGSKPLPSLTLSQVWFAVGWFAVVKLVELFIECRKVLLEVLFELFDNVITAFQLLCGLLNFGVNLYLGRSSCCIRCDSRLFDNRLLLGIDNTGCISVRDNSIFLNGDRLIATEEG